MQLTEAGPTLSISTAAEPTILIDTGSPDPAITDLGFVALHPTQRIVVADRYTRQVFAMSPTGQIQHVWGQQGDGPGEFQSITWMGTDHQGRVLLWDRRRARMTAWSVQGELLGEGRVPPWITQMRGRPEGTVADGRVVFGQPEMVDLGTKEPGEPFGTEREVRLWEWGNGDGAPRTPQAAVAGPVQQMFAGRAAGSGYRIARNILFSSETLLAGDGHHLVLLDTGRGRVGIIDVEAPERSAVVELSIGRGRPPRIGQGEIEREREARLGDDSGVGAPVLGIEQAIESAIKGLGAAPVRPRFGTLRSGPEPGSVLLAGYRAAYETKSPASITTWCEWSTLSWTTRYCLELPSNLELVGIQHGHAVVVEPLENGLRRLLRMEVTGQSAR